MKKGIIGAILAVMVVLSMSGIVMADGDVGATVTKTVEMNYTLAESYEWSIPTTALTLVVGQDGKGTASGAVTAGKVLIADNQHLTITFSSPNDKQLVLVGATKGTAGKYITYTVSGSSAIGTGDVVIDINAGEHTTDTVTNTLTFTAADMTEAKYVGTYKDNLTFTAEVKTKSS